MLAACIRYLRGYLKIRISGYSPERFLNLCSYHHIYLWGLTPASGAYELFISVSGFRRLKPIIRKSKTKVQIEKRYGLPFFLHKYRARKVFFGGAVFCAVFVYLMSLFVWNIHIEGNYSRTDEVILEFLESKHVRHGMRKSEIDCGRITKDIRKQFDDIIWVSASVKGTRLLLQVKENTDTFPVSKENESEAADLVAEKDGTVLEMVTRAGVPQVKPGDSIKAGDMLVCGRVEVRNDAKEVIDYKYRRSDADIYVKTTQNYEEALASSYLKKEYTGKKKRQLFLRFGTYELSFGSLKHSFKESETETSERQLKLGEHFYFPVCFGKKTVKQYESKKKTYERKELQQILSLHFKQFCKDLEEKGVEILENNVKIYTEQTGARAKGTLVLKEKLGKPVPTEVIEIEEKETGREE